MTKCSGRAGAILFGPGPGQRGRAMLLVDAHDALFQEAVVVSNDSDLELPIRMVRQKFGLPVGVLHPHKEGSV